MVVFSLVKGLASRKSVHGFVCMYIAKYFLCGFRCISVWSLDFSIAILKCKYISLVSGFQSPF